jgi:hypothetical protein
MSAATPRKKNRKGFMLMELVIGMLMLSIVMITLAAMTLQVASRSVRITGDSYRNAILVREVNRLQTIPYSALTVGTTTITETSLPYKHTRTITVTNPTFQLKLVKIVIAPTRSGFKADSITIKRMRATSNTFDTGLQ